MHNCTLIVVCGHSANGQHGLAHDLSRRLELPIVSHIALADMVMGPDAAQTALQITDYIAREQLRAGNSLVIDLPHHASLNATQYTEWQADYHFNCVQILAPGVE